MGKYGPLWISSDMDFGGGWGGTHARVLCSMQTNDAYDWRQTVVDVKDPWQKGMTRFQAGNTGSEYSEPFGQLAQEIKDLGDDQSSVKGLFIVAHMTKTRMQK